VHPPAPPLRLTELGQIGLNVNKLSVSVPFYRDVLGIPYLFSAPPSLAFFQVGTVRLMLAEPETPGEPARPNSPLYFKVPDVHTARHVDRPRRHLPGCPSLRR
jgi:catechol-2,3-dioxygenase